MGHGFLSVLAKMLLHHGRFITEMPLVVRSGDRNGDSALSAQQRLHSCFTPDVLHFLYWAAHSCSGGKKRMKLLS